MTKKITILDTTLRDGSYAIDYQFTTEDTITIASALEEAGFNLIEVGHGVGLNASNCGKGKAIATDEQYLEAAASALKKAKFGMFFIPGIGREQDLKMAADYGMSFVRIGTNVTEVDNSAKYIEIAKNLGMQVSANLMKSYVLSSIKFLKQAKKSEEFGSDILVVVDSAGGMFPKEVTEYISILKDNTELPIGFHGHNNFGLAIANALAAIEAGAIRIDGTLRGMGRSAGNVQMEVFILVLEKLGYFTGINVRKTMQIAEKLIKPLMRREQAISPLDAIVGYAQFHSSFLPVVHKIAKKYEIDLYDLIIEISKVEKVNVTLELVQEVAREMKKNV